VLSHLSHLLTADGVPIVVFGSTKSTDDNLLSIMSCRRVELIHRTKSNEGPVRVGETEEPQEEDADVNDEDRSERASREEAVRWIGRYDEGPENVVIAVTKVVS
jgi:hypothetical protein